MKQKVTLLFIIVLVAGGMVGYANDGDDGEASRHNRCNPAGTWYAELPSPPYVATITPIQGHSRYSVMYQGVYGPSLDVAIIAILGGGVDGGPPWDVLQTWGVKGHIEFSEDCNTMDVTWPGGIYAWVWDTVTDPFVPPPIPWVDEPSFQFGDDPILETYHRMPMPTD